MRVELNEANIGPAASVQRARAPASAPPVAAPPPAAAAPDIATPAPPLTFDLPPSLLKSLVATSAAYLLVMGLAFRGGAGLGLIFAVFGLVLAGYYGLPVVLARASGHVHSASRRGAWGIDTASGYLPGHAAWAQIMTVPLLMLGWAVLVAMIV